MIKEIEIDGKIVPFKASAAIPRIYRKMFQRDIFTDLTGLTDSIEDNNISIASLECFENIAFVMAKHADPSIPETADDWLDGFNTFSIYQVLPQIIELWGLNTKTIAKSKKK